MTFKKYMVDLIKNQKTKKRILLVDGNEQRSLLAAILHNSEGFIKPLLLLEEHNEDIEKQVPTIVISDYKDRKEELIELYLAKRKGKETREQAEKVIFQPPYFAMLLVEMKEVDGVVGGLSYPTSEILRPAFKVVGPQEGVKTISSLMIMERADEWYLFSDVSVIPEPTKEQLVDIAINTSNFAKQINFKTKVAFLSFSTSGSATHDNPKKVREASEIFNETYKPKYQALGEIQFDAAFSPEIRQSKYKDEGFKKNPTIFVFPSLNAGNIGYKIAQRMAGFGAIGPIVTGLKKPVNDLSRGATTIDVYNTALITALQVEED